MREFGGEESRVSGSAGYGGVYVLAGAESRGKGGDAWWRCRCCPSRRSRNGGDVRGSEDDLVTIEVESVWVSVVQDTLLVVAVVLIAASCIGPFSVLKVFPPELYTGLPFSLMPSPRLHG